jgi:kynureninase
LHLDDQVKAGMAKIVGAQPAEVAVMETLTVNLHLLMASFYRPTKEKYKIVIEGKAFPSDHYAVQSHLAHHNLSTADALVVIAPSDVDRHYFSTRHICDTIAAHAADTALVLLPGIHYYTGQLFDIKTITAFAHSLNIPIGWDLAHAAGNVPLHLHDWDVDFAAWCTYKYLNAGPGAIGALFVHERHGKVTRTDPPPPPLRNGADPTNANLTLAAANADNDHATYTYTPRLSGWWGSSKTSRFAMRNVFLPIPGASGWQLSNPSALDVTSVLASLSVHEATSMAALRTRSRRLTAYLELLLERWPPGTAPRPYVLLTPREAEERGAQISIRLRPGMLERVLAALEADGVVVDERKPDVIRVAPAPLYNTFLDVWRFVESLWRALEGVGLEDGQKGG